MTIELAGEEVRLDPRGFAEVRGMALVADLHLGKERAYRQWGVPVPEGASRTTLDLLCEIGHETDHLVILGDLFHSPNAIEGSTLATWKDWCGSVGCRVTLVRGNHDRWLPDLGHDVVRSLEVGILTLAHDLREGPGVCGHIHPVVGLGHDRVRCFWRREDLLVLPAFGTFTGGYRVREGEAFAITPSQIFRANLSIV